MGCTDTDGIWGTYGIGEHTGVQGDMKGHMDVWGAYRYMGVYECMGVQI